jgi:DNA-binding protein
VSAATLFLEEKREFIILKATGNAISKGLLVSEIIKRRIKGLHQVTKLGNIEVKDVFEPRELGLDTVV